MAVLYQKYRPQRFAEVVGQDGIVRTLRNAARNNQLAHAYLFTGSRGIGKTTLARLIAKAANCQNLDDGDPCGTCNPCLAITAGNFLDVVEIDAASHTGVDNVRELIEHVQFKPSHGRMKVFIVDEVHMLSKAAFNALLKTLEEPPSHAMFILATTDIEKVPDTIISRTQRFDYRKISNEHMLAALKKIAEAEQLQLPDGTLKLVIANAEGGMRDALSLLDTVASLGGTITIEDVRMLLGLTSTAVVEELVGYIELHNAAKIPEFIEAQTVVGSDFVVFNRHVLEYLRQMLVAKITSVVPVTT
nr:DNA polymerase III subunit gamma/tau [bacterium]